MMKDIKKIHTEENLNWAGEVPTTLLLDYFKKYGLTQNSDILEIGCGEGQNAIFLMKNGYNIQASDVSPEAIMWCKKKAREQGVSDKNFFVLDVLNNNLQEKYDFIYSISTLHMLVLDEDRHNFLKFIHSHLKENGRAMITIMGDGEMEQNNSDITKSFELTDRPFNNKIVKVAATSCRIVNWSTFIQELQNANLLVIEHFNSKEISGFDNSMVVICKKA